MDKRDRLAQELIDKGSYQVRDVEIVRQHIKMGEYTSQKTYDNLTRVIAETGTLVMPFHTHPEIQIILRETCNG